MRKVADFLDCAFLWSCRTLKASSDTFHNWGPLMQIVPVTPGQNVCTHAQPGCASACASIIHAEKLVNCQNLTLHLHLVSAEYSGMLLEDYHLGSGKPGRDTSIII